MGIGQIFGIGRKASPEKVEVVEQEILSLPYKETRLVAETIHLVGASDRNGPYNKIIIFNPGDKITVAGPIIDDYEQGIYIILYDSKNPNVGQDFYFSWSQLRDMKIKLNKV